MDTVINCWHEERAGAGFTHGATHDISALKAISMV